MGTDKRRDWISPLHSFNLIRDNLFHPWLKFFGFSRTEEFFDHGFHGWAWVIAEQGFVSAGDGARFADNGFVVV